MRVLRRQDPLMTGADVKRWQFFLIGQGFNSGIVDGVFGTQTHDATVAFQARHGLEQDGIVGLKTQGQAMLLGFEAINDSDPSRSGPNWPEKPDFKPLVSNTARQDIFGEFRYQHKPLPGNPEHIEVLGSWFMENIENVRIPQLIGKKDAPGNGVVKFHRLAAAQLTRLWQEWQDQGLIDRVLTWSGSYNNRFIRGSTSVLSNHAFGTAFDINFQWNRLGTQPALVGQEGSVRELVSIAHAHGFYWGGHFSRKDGMHFEVAKVQ